MIFSFLGAFLLFPAPQSTPRSVAEKPFSIDLPSNYHFTVDAAPHRILPVSPLSAELREVSVNGRALSIPGARAFVLKTLSSTVEFTYR